MTIGRHVYPVSIEASFLITGNTWSFRQRLDAFGVALGYTGEDQQRKYFRLLQSQDMTNEEHRSSLAKELSSVGGSGGVRDA